EKIIGAELELDPARQVEIVREALLRAANAESVEVRVHPDDLAICEQNIQRLQEAFADPKPIRFTADPGLAPGSCFIETNLGNVDARLKSELDMILAELLKARQIG
ncbi:MAG TPA: FliH/SctL family protein, partial [Bacillota bacterium]